MEILELKKIQNENILDGQNEDDRVSKLEDRAIDISHTEEYRPD